MLFPWVQPFAQFQEKGNRRDVVGHGEKTEEIVLKRKLVHRSGLPERYAE